MLHLDADQIRTCTDYLGFVDALKAMNKQGVDVIDRLLLSQPKPQQLQKDWLLLPAWNFDRYFGVKLVSVFPENPHHNLPAVQGIYVLFDGRNGAAIATLDGAALTLAKTAANSAMAADLLARKDCELLLVCGGGALAPHLIAAHCAVRKIKHVAWWSRRPEILAPGPLRAAGLPVEVISDLAAAAQAADIISTATRATTPIIEGTWLKPGCHLDLVGGYLPEMREADDTAFSRASRHYVDTRLTTIGVVGDVCDPIASGLTTEDALIDMFQLNRGEKPGRQSHQEITWFKSGGGGHEDLAVAQYIYSRHLGAN